MIETIIPYDLDVVPFVAVGFVVALFAGARVHASDRWWCPDAAWFWWPLRRLLWPPLDVALAHVPYGFAKTRVTYDEIVAVNLDVTHEEYLERVTRTGYEAQPLASIARLDEDAGVTGAGQLERSSIARYVGPKPLGLEGLPEWLRRYQVHRRVYGPDGELTDTAHFEYNPWRPDLALPHLLGIGLDVHRGVEIAADDLYIESHEP